MRYKKFGFTMAEVMLVLTILGVMMAIIIPTAFNSMPNENIVKFKKANNAFGTVIRELANSGDYYTEGDLTNPKVSMTNATLCNSIADLLSVKATNCVTTATTGVTGYVTGVSAANKQSLDTQCATAGNSTNKTKVGSITTNDNIIWYDANPNVNFQNATAKFKTNQDANGFYNTYKVFCIDVDGLDFETPPFGYGIRFDGKILTGENADTWIAKSVQDKE